MLRTRKWIALTLVMVLMAVPFTMARAEVMEALRPSVASGFATMAKGAVNPAVVEGAFVQTDAQGNRTYRFDLVDGITYDNGNAVTAADYVFAALVLCSPERAEQGRGDEMNRFVGSARQNSFEPMSGVRLLSENSFSLTIEAGLSLSDELERVSLAPCPMHDVAPNCDVRDDGQGAYLAVLPGVLPSSVLWEQPVPLSNGELGDEPLVAQVRSESDWDQVPEMDEIQVIVAAIAQHDDYTEPVTVVRAMPAAAPIPVAQVATPRPQVEMIAQRVDVAADAVRIDDGRCMMTLRATLIGFDGLSASVQWQCNEGSGWRDVPNANGLVYEVEVTQQNMNYDWRAIASVIS